MRTTILLTIEPDMKDNVTVDLSLSSHIRRVALKRFLDLGREETGAALVITLAVFLLMYLGIMGVFAVSTAMKERIHLQNACDAAAYSAAVVQADTLSRIATINRAMSWTYVQMTRRQMDYIVLRWLTHTKDHYKIDRDGADRYNKEGFFHGPCGTHGSIGVGWFIGTDPNNMGTKERVRLNGFLTSYLGIDSMPGAEITSLLNLGSTPRITDVEAALKAYSTSAVYKEIKDSQIFTKPQSRDGWKDYSADKDSIFSSLKEDLKVSADEPFSNIETADSVAMMWEQLNGVNGKYEGHGNAVERLLQAQIVLDRLNIALMNITERRLVRQMTKKISSVVKDVVKANIPSNMADKCAFLLSQNEDPLDGEITGSGDGYFINLHNTKSDEARFLRFAGYTSKLVDVYMNAKSDESSGGGIIEETIDDATAAALVQTAAGVNQWFVRGGTRRNGGVIRVGRTDGDRGLQRCYKHWAEGPFANIHATHSPLPPSCWNTEEDYLEGSPATVALYSEWCWWSDVWCCPKILWKRRHWHPWPHKSKIWPMKMECDHNDKPGMFGMAEFKDTVKAIEDLTKSIDDIESLVTGAFEGRTDSDGNVITLDENTYTNDVNQEINAELDKTIDKELDEYGKYSNSSDYTYTSNKESDLSSFSTSGIDNFEDGCLITLPGLNLTSHVVGYGRLYADAPQIYNSCYVGERAKPLILSRRYFGRAGTISVGIRRENVNVFQWILGKIEGFFNAFNPDWNGEDVKTYTYVFASAKAGYKNKGEAASSREYKIDWQPQRQEWNLCQPDWDVVFVPVRRAYSTAESGRWLETVKKKESESGNVVNNASGEDDEGDDDNMLRDWVSSSDWKSLDGENVSFDSNWDNTIAPGGILRGKDHIGILDWKGLSHVLYH